MSTRAIQGRNVTMRIGIDGVLLPYACATSINYHINTELVRRTSVGAGSHTKYKARLTDTTAELSGVTHIIPQDAAYTVFDLARETVRKKGVQVEIKFLDGESNVKTITGYALIPDIDINAGADGFSEDTINLQFSGAPGIFNEPPPSSENSNDVDWAYYEGQNGETGIVNNNLIGRTKVAVFRGGPLDVITTGTPTVKQVKYNSSLGQLLFSVPLGPGEPVWYQWKQ
jgi:hypothetical protein